MERRNQIELKFPPKGKTRLTWTPELHDHFIKAVNQLGGPFKATPKSIMHLMDIPEIGLTHLKSHLQKYRLSMYGQLNTMIYTRGFPRQSSELAEDGILGISHGTKCDLNPHHQNKCFKFPKLASIQSGSHAQFEAEGKSPIGYIPAASGSSTANDQFSEVYPQKTCAGMSSRLVNPGKPQISLNANSSSVTGDGVEMTCIMKHNNLHWLESLEEKNDFHNTHLARGASDDLTLRIGLHWRREETLASFSKQKPDEKQQ